MCRTRYRNFAKELKELGNEVTFFGQVLLDVKNSTDVFPIQKNGLKIIGMNRKKNKILSYIHLYLKAIPQIWKADFVYFFYPTALRFLIFFAILFRKKYGLYLRGIDDLKNTESHLFYRNAFIVFTVADFFTNYVNKIAGRTVAQNIRPMIGFSEEDITLNRTYRNPQDVFKILYLGRMTNDKGIIELLHAVKILKEKNIESHLTLVGSGEYLEELQELTKNLQISAQVNFAGALFDKAQIKNEYLEADIYALPTYHEGFPRTLYEAMIFGTPIVTSFVGGISGVMTNRENCIEVQPKSVEDLADKLLFAHQNYSEMINFAKNGQETIRKLLNTRKNSHAQDLNLRLKK